MLGCVAKSVSHLTQEPEALGSVPGPATQFHFLFMGNLLIQEEQLSVWQKYEHLILVHGREGVSLPRTTFMNYCWLSSRSKHFHNGVYSFKIEVAPLGAEWWLIIKDRSCIFGSKIGSTLLR